MIGGFEGIAKIPDLRRRVFFTLGMLVVYRLGVFVPTPGIDAEKLKRLFEQASSTLFGMVNMFSGGALENFSVFALGIAPYISVSIIVQLLTPVVKRLEELSKEEGQGRRMITRYTRLGTVALAIVQGLLISIGLERQEVVTNPGLAFRIVTVITLTSGTAFIMWLGEQITERGIGNGMSIIIFAGIVARMPTTMLGTLALVPFEISPGTMIALLIFAALTVFFIVFVERCQRRIPVQYPRRVVAGNRMVQANTQYLPLKLNSSGVIPAIFASMFLSFLGMIAHFSPVEGLGGMVSFLTPASFGYEFTYAVLIIMFCYFHLPYVSDPEKIAENLKKAGGFIPQVRPGKDTSVYLGNVLLRLTLWGSLYVCAICIMPSLFYIKMGATGFSAFFGGTAVLIVVGVMLDTISQIESHLVARNYERFTSKGAGKVRGMSKGVQIGGRLIQR